MASKKMKRLGKAAALLGAAYAASKIGGNKSGITDTGDLGSENKNVSALISGDSANTSGAIKSASPNYGFNKRSIIEDIKGVGKKIGKAFQGPADMSSPIIPDSMMPMANKGMFVTVKTKIGKNKKTKIC
jgi:hypothetical protein